MRRFTFLFFMCLLCACGTDRAPAPAPATVTDAPPNFVFIFADDLGYGDLGCFGATDIATPHLDRMARDGMKFTAFYSASPVCSPSRAALLTGRLPQRTGINGVFFPESFTGLPPAEITLAEMLRGRGYVNGMVGKWHLGHLERFLPLQQGFDAYYGIPYSNDMESVVYLSGNAVDSFSVDQRYLTRTYTERALEFLDTTAADRPFFLYLAHNMPHVPIYASPAFAGGSERGLYGDVIQELDWSVGQILAKLEAMGVSENTLVVFSSDNGPWLVMEDHGGSAGPLREGKQYTFEGGMRVPTLALWPGRVPAGSSYDGAASQLDWFPTFANLSGASLPADRPLDGVDITPVLSGTGRRPDRGILFLNYEYLQAYRRGDYKVKIPYAGFAGARWKRAVAAHDTLLFNLTEDPGERNNLFPAQPERARALLREMHENYAALGPLPPSQVIRSGADDSHYTYVERLLARRDRR